jgi:hypothetical protein
LTEGCFIENLRNQTHIAVELYFLAVGGGDACTLLTAVLKSEQCKKGKPRHILTRTVNAKDAAFLV